MQDANDAMVNEANDAKLLSNLRHKGIAKIFWASSLYIGPFERKSLLETIDKIMDFIDLLAELDIEDVEPFVNPVDREKNLEAGCPLRNDDDMYVCDRQEIMRNAPLSEDDFFCVPQIMQ